MEFSIEIHFTQEINPDWLSKLIMWAEGTNYSHSLCIFKDIDGIDKLYHSIGDGSLVTNDLGYLKSHKPVRSYRVPMAVSLEDFSKWVHARAKKGIEYSESQYVNQFLRLIKIPWVLIKNGDSKSICSEEMFCALRFSKLAPDMMDLDQDMISPKMLESFLSKHPLAEKI